MRKFLLALAAVSTFAIGAAAPAVAEDVLGSRVVAHRSETDVIPVPGKQRYSAIRICVKRRAVRFRDLDVVYGNGGRQDLAIRRLIPAGECTRWINLLGKRRDIRRIVLRYDTFGDRGPRAVVTAYGR